jgi:MoCo/4Fe-4S cofactor protein with predicted Tat translocation signal
MLNLPQITPVHTRITSAHARETPAPARAVPPDLAARHARLQAAQGPEYWRSLEELADSPTFREFVQREFPQQASEWHDAVSRRRFLQLMGASLGLAGLTACGKPPDEQIVPYVRAPKDAMVPGKPQAYATTTTLGGVALGVLATSVMGRPIKIEGNPQHPASLGATDAFAQAAVLTLYDPDRAQAVLQRGQISTWESFLIALHTALGTQSATGGAGMRVLTETVTSPTLAQQLRLLRTTFPAAAWHQYEPVNNDTVQAGARLAFGQDVVPLYHFEKADVILALDADFVACEPATLRYAHDFAQRRRVHGASTAMNRLYVIESMLSLTGAIADHRLPVRPSAVAGLARALARTLGNLVQSSATAVSPTVPLGRLEPDAAATHADWARAVAEDLWQHRGASLVLAGRQQPPLVHALAHAMNEALGNVGHTVVYTAPVAAEPVEHQASLRALVEDMAAGRVELLVILGGNPVYTAPADVPFATALRQVPFCVHLSLYANETSAHCHWHIPEAHELESWGDARAYDGTVSLLQPLIAPLYNGKSASELLAVLLAQREPSGRELVREYWRSQYQGSNFEQFWRAAVHDGLLANTAFPSQEVTLRTDWLTTATAPAAPVAGLEVQFLPDPTVWDGRFANNGWLQELPKPITKLTWDNAALLSPATAQRLGLDNEAVVELRLQGRTARASVWIVPGHADDAVTVHLGYGRWRSGRVGSGTGFNAYALRTSAAMWADQGLEVRPTGERYALATTQHHHSMEGRDLVRAGTLQEYLERPHFAQEMAHASEPQVTLYPSYVSEGYAWGMAIDLSACLGCNACVVACQAENNIPIVGKTEVQRGREMHWIRIDRYYKGTPHRPAVYHQPVLCMHCEHAPCEVVCPTYATVHNHEGLNDMVYNRCIGTRYCSNNCPYKVRRFNFLQYADYHTPSLQLLHNPEVTVRTRGVMEKCTYCVQRISAARIQAKLEDRAIRDGEVVTACQAACPTGAIVFGNLHDPSSRVANLKATPLHYGLLVELNTRPRTTYLAHLRNPNPHLRDAAG